MTAKNLIEMTKQTVDEVDRILRMDNANYVKEFGCEMERTPLAKIEKVSNMISTLNFFIDRYYDQNPQDRPDYEENSSSDLNTETGSDASESMSYVSGSNKNISKKGKKKYSGTPIYG